MNEENIQKEEEKEVQASEALPTSDQFANELIRVKYKLRYRRLLKNSVYALLVVAAISVLIATLLLPVLEIYGNSMNPTLKNGEIVISLKTSSLDRGDICCMYYNNRVLIKRVIGLAGDVIDMDNEGNVYVNGVIIDEPYVEKKYLGECDIKFPYTVPEQTIFVLGDNRETSVDSRNSQLGAVSSDEIIGKIVFRIWPFSSIGTIK